MEGMKNRDRQRSAGADRGGQSRRRGSQLRRSSRAHGKSSSRLKKTGTGYSEKSTNTGLTGLRGGFRGGEGENSTAIRRERVLKRKDEVSAGGLVVSGLAEAVEEDGSVNIDRIYAALIGRLDQRGRLMWSIPKGHVEGNESLSDTAEREVWEETGLRSKVICELGPIEYWFVASDTTIYKTVHHHLLRYVDGDLNDEDPEVTEVAWIPFSQLVEHLAYNDERTLAHRALAMIDELAREAKAQGQGTPR